MPVVRRLLHVPVRRLLLPALLGWTSTTAFAAECEAVVNSDDLMRFDTNRIEVGRSCETFTVTLNHVGWLPKMAMGHRWVLTRAEDMQATVQDALAAGAHNDYLMPGDERVIAHTRMVKGGESDSVAFPVSALSADEDYIFFCTFPGHFAVMQGVLALVD